MLGFSDAQGNLTRFGEILTVIVYIVVLVTLILNGAAGKSKEALQIAHEEELDKAINGQVYLESILSSVDSVNQNICAEMIREVDGDIFNTPEANLRIIAKEIQNCCSIQFKLHAKRILVSLAYCIEDKSHPETWLWANPEEVQGGLSLDELTTNPGTAFYSIKTGISQFVYYNDKIKAISEGKYVPDERDRKHRNVGSIVVDDISVVTENGKVARAILSISTFTKQISNSNAAEDLKEVEKNLVDILDHFDDSIRKELTAIVLRERRLNSLPVPTENGGLSLAEDLLAGATNN